MAIVETSNPILTCLTELWTLPAESHPPNASDTRPPVASRRPRAVAWVAVRSDAEHLRLGGAELLVREDALVVQPLDVAELV
jgi:hypothetical protein